MKKRNKKELSIFKEFNHKMKEKKPFEIDNSQNEFIQAKISGQSKVVTTNKDDINGFKTAQKRFKLQKVDESPKENKPETRLGFNPQTEQYFQFPPVFRKQTINP